MLRETRNHCIRDDVFSIRSWWAKEMLWGSDRIVNTQGVHQPIENKGDKFLLWRESGSSTPGFSVVYEGPSLAYCEKGPETGVMTQAGKDLQA